MTDEKPSKAVDMPSGIERRYGVEARKMRMAPDPWKDPKVVAGIHKGEMWALKLVLSEDDYAQVERQRAKGIFMGRKMSE